MGNEGLGMEDYVSNVWGEGQGAGGDGREGNGE